MSQYKNDSTQPTYATVKNEEYYDLHPSPWDIEFVRITENIIAYIDHVNIETFLIEIRYDSWKEALKYEKLWVYMLRNSDVEIYRSRKKLFLRRLMF